MSRGPHGRNPVGLLLWMEVRQMPMKPKRPCSFPGCPKLTEGRFCEEHERQENRRYEKYDRDPAVRRRYGRAWKRIRDRYAAKHPFCEECYKKGLLCSVEEAIPRLISSFYAFDPTPVPRRVPCGDFARPSRLAEISTKDPHITN